MIKRSFIVLAVIVLVSGCIDYKSYLKTDIDASFKVVLPVDISTPGMKTAPFEFDVTKSFSPIGEPALADYLGNIRAITLTGISATVTGLSESIVLTDPTLSVSDGVDTVFWTFDEITITEGSTLSLTNENEEFSAISAMLSTLGSLDVTFSGLSDTNNVQYSLEVELTTKVTAGL